MTEFTSIVAGACACFLASFTFVDVSDRYHPSAKVQVLFLAFLFFLGVLAARGMP